MCKWKGPKIRSRRRQTSLEEEWCQSKKDFGPQLETTWFLKSQKRRQRRRSSKPWRSYLNTVASMWLTLRNKLSNMKMTKSENVASYFMRIIEVQDKLKSSGNNLEKKDLVVTTLNGPPPSWESFIQTISGRTKLPKFDGRNKNHNTPKTSWRPTWGESSVHISCQERQGKGKEVL